MKFMYLLLLAIMLVAGCASKPQKPVPMPLPEPLPDTKETKYCFIGDMGTGTSDQFKIGKFLAAENCDKIVVLGDVIYSTRIKSADDPKFKERFWNPYKEILEGTKIPWYIALGNHDWYIPGNPHVWKDLAKKFDVLYFP